MAEFKLLQRAKIGQGNRTGPKTVGANVGAIVINAGPLIRQQSPAKASCSVFLISNSWFSRVMAKTS